MSALLTLMIINTVSSVTRINNPKIPTMLYDGDCGFCMRFVKSWRRTTGDAIRYRSYQEALAEFPQVSAEACRVAVQLISADGSVVSGAHAVFKAMDYAGKFRTPHWLYEHIPLFDRISEFAYQFVAHRRLFFSRILGGSANKCV